jgi:hypothetical protein
VEVDVFKTRVFFFQTTHLAIFAITFFSGTNQGSKLGGISEKMSNNIGYKFQILIHYKYKAILVGS